MYMDANKIKTMDRWECDDYVIFEDEGSFIVAQIVINTIGWCFGSNSSHDLWFQSYAQAREFLKEESCVDGRFKKVKGE